MNPSAKWFYDWEVGAARDRRAMTHVFEVYVFYERAPSSQLSQGNDQPSMSSSRTHYNSLQVVAVATSSAFTLVSFRRAAARGGATESTEAGSGTRTGQPQQTLQQQRTMLRKAPQTASLGDTRAGAAGVSRYTGDKHGGSDQDENELGERSNVYEEAQYEYDEEKVEYGSTELLERTAISPHVYPSKYPAVDEADNNRYQRQTVEEVETLSLVAVAAKNLALVYWFLCRVPVDALVPIASRIQELLYATLCNHMDSDLMMNDSTLATDRDLFERLLQQLVDTTARPPTYLPSTDGVTEAAAEGSLALLEVSIKLALWLLLDKDNNTEMEKFLQRSARVLLDRDALVQSYETWVEWVHERVDEFLYTHGWSLSRLLSGIIAQEENAQWSSSDSLPPGMMKQGHEQLHELLTGDGAEWIASGQEVFIAHARELYISESRLPIAPLHVQLRIGRQAGELQSPTVPSLASSSIGGTRAGSSRVASQLSGVWLWHFDSFSTRSLRPQASSALESGQPQEDTVMGTVSFLWLLRQLTCIHLTFTNEDAVPALLIRSAFNSRTADANGDRVTRLVLDQHHHWFQSLPSGESSIATRIGGLSLGDYVGSVAVNPGSGSAAVKICSYAWPTVSRSSTSSSQQFAYRWHWQLSLDSDDSEQLSVTVVVERSASPIADPQDSHSPVDLSTEPLSIKVNLVKRWVSISEYKVCYRRLDGE